jgi:E1A-binding protein p400
MHFLMPHIFRSRKEFSYWFNNPLSSMVEGNRNVNNDLISRLHSIMRPFLLRRLKKDVAKQLPAKYEHTVMCKLSKRQQYLYEEFMSRSSTRSLMTGGNYMGMMNILMQLRKCCNHPDLFEVRSIISPFVLPGLHYNPGFLVTRAMERDPLNSIDKFWLNCLSIDEDNLVLSEVSRLQISKKAFMNAIEDFNMDTPRSIKDSQFNLWKM